MACANPEAVIPAIIRASHGINRRGRSGTNRIDGGAGGDVRDKTAETAESTGRVIGEEGYLATDQRAACKVVVPGPLCVNPPVADDEASMAPTGKLTP